MPGYNRYIVAFEFRPSSPVNTPSSGPCPGCSGCSDCKKKKFPGFPFYNTRNPGTLNNDLPQPLAVQSQETRTTDTNEEEYKEGDKCFYQPKDGPFEEGTVVSVDKSVKPFSYRVQLLPRTKETIAENLRKELPSYYTPENLQEHPLHLIQSKPVIAQTGGPLSQTQNELNRQLKHLTGKSLKKKAMRSRRAQEDTGKHRQNNTDVDEPVYPEADYDCMSFKKLY